MYKILQFACVVMFLVKVPMLIAVRVRANAPWWFVSVAATALGWLLSNASAYLQHLVGDAQRVGYKPLAGLIYGPLYLLYCSLPYWLFFGRRSAVGLSHRHILLAAAASAIEWAVIVAEGVHADPYVLPPLSVAAAFVVSWTADTQVLQRLGRRGAA